MATRDRWIQEREREEGFDEQTDREIQMMKLTRHPLADFLCCISISLFLLLFIISLFLSLNHSSSISSSSSSFSTDHFRNQQLLGQHHPSTRLLMAMEEKARLGSTPPSCYNKCNGCHPCQAVQVPTGPIISHRSISTDGKDSLHQFQPEGDGYSNYKPLGWKCRCRNRLFNP
ncbi:hypothetical protein SAY87_002278 [Trapa incisa]|uniref:Epidermal patterning factor-like protein n=1 Tax=Trapa incisa TaxID=236973 RepID=A0AAN7PUR4_9MYRT|nr:hypothetical protein SAY87_002278 [Trapa incisa]